jgi:hypothetical protein
MEIFYLPLSLQIFQDLSQYTNSSLARTSNFLGICFNASRTKRNMFHILHNYLNSGLGKSNVSLFIFKNKTRFRLNISRAL